MNPKLLILALLALLLNSCTQHYQGPNQQYHPMGKIEKNDTVIAINDSAKKDLDTTTKVIIEYNVTGKAVFTNSYCGGAWPPQEVLDQYEQEHPLTNSTFELRNTKSTNSSIKISTDNKGNFKANLDPGIYNYYMTKTYNKKMGAAFTSDCEKWMKRCYGQLIITQKQQTGYNLFFGFGCNPCEPPRP